MTKTVHMETPDRIIAHVGAPAPRARPYAIASRMLIAREIPNSNGLEEEALMLTG